MGDVKIVGVVGDGGKSAESRETVRGYGEYSGYC